MSGRPDSKRKLLATIQILKNETDPDHPMSMQHLLQRLEDLGIAAERKSLYADIELFNSFSIDFNGSGADQISYRKPHGYYYEGGLFELADLRMLAEAVASSRSMTDTHSRELLDKLESLAGNRTRRLFRQVLVTDRVKTENRTVPYVIDVIDQCLETDRQIQFLYNDWVLGSDGTLRQVPRHDGQLYMASPYTLLWDDEKYYMIAGMPGRGIVHFRVDKMTDAAITLRPREGMKNWHAVNPSVYTKSTFGMFNGERKGVLLRFPPALLGVMVDRFGSDLAVQNVPNAATPTLETRVSVVVSPQFFGWVCGIGPDLTIAAPASVVEDYRTHLQNHLQHYK